MFETGFDPNITFSFIILRDLAQAFAKVIEEREKRYLAEYMACSTGPLSYAQVATTLEKEMGRSIQIVQNDFYTAVQDLQSMVAGNSEESHGIARDGVQRLVLYYNFYGIKGNTIVLEWLVARKPTTLEAFFRHKIDSYTADSS